jgi:SMC interacting uncharacterized protein involved in chromosome segregation
MRSRQHEQMEEYIKLYEEKILELQQDIKDKDDIIFEFHQGSDLSRLIEFSVIEGDDRRRSSGRSASTPFLHSIDNINYTFDEDNGNLSLNQDNFEITNRMTVMLKNNIIENEELRLSVNQSNQRITEIKSKHKEDKEKIENLEKDISLLRKHYIVLEREKLNIDKKNKMLEFKVQRLENDNTQYRNSLDELENQLDKSERKCTTLQDNIRQMVQLTKTQDFLQSSMIHRNPNMSISRVSSG